SRTMQIAQRLYESGKITYMRTDSVNLSDTALGDITRTIKGMYGDKYHQFRKYKNKNESAQEAHEAIRPTYMENTTVEDADGKKLYELIWKRTMASQMADAVLERTTANIEISTQRAILKAEGEVLKFDGFLKVYREGRDEEELEEQGEESMLPPLKTGQQLPLVEMNATEKFSRPAPRYTEASLVKKLEELGIGRPSTYAPTITTILKRGYVEKREKEGVARDVRIIQLKEDVISKKATREMTGAEKGKLFPTDLGLVVTDFLKQHFETIMDYGFTAQIEEEFDHVADGKMKWNKMLSKFYTPFKKNVEETIETAERIKGERELGIEQKTGKKIVARMGRFGPMVQIGDVADEEKPRFAALRKDQSIETITLEDAMKLFELPKTLGEHEGAELVVNTGRFGPYIKLNDQFISIPRGEDPLDITLERALAIIQEKQNADAPVGYYESKPITKGKGRFGPFIKWDGMFINVPRKYNFDALSQQDMEELIDAKMEKEANRFIVRWPEENISVENGRWGPFIRFGKKMLKLGKKKNDTKYTSEEAALLTIEEVKAMILAQVPGAFSKVTKASKAPAKKAASKKAPAKKAATKKAAKKK
ncbi:MAG: DNA topoisomerase I, partial [Bacteroidetes bacterium]|nr:DNA topoisomerase I [Bacteroidota bacterium]